MQKGLFALCIVLMAWVNTTFAYCVYNNAEKIKKQISISFFNAVDNEGALVPENSVKCIDKFKNCLRKKCLIVVEWRNGIKNSQNICTLSINTNDNIAVVGNPKNGLRCVVFK